MVNLLHQLKRVQRVYFVWKEKQLVHVFHVVLNVYVNSVKITLAVDVLSVEQNMILCVEFIPK